MNVGKGEASGNPNPDQELMTAFFGCSEAAFQKLAERWWPRLFGYFRRLGAGSEDAEDLAVQTLMKLYLMKESRRFDLSRPLAPFLFTAAKRVYIAWLRELDREPKTEPLFEKLPLAANGGEPHPELSASLLQCVQALPEPEQLYVMMCGRHGLGDLSHNEIAETLDKWPAQVTQISKRARALLKRCLETKGFG